MKYLWLSLFCALSLLSTNAQIVNTWNADWQNSCLEICAPSSVVITNLTTNTTAPNMYTANISIFFSAATLALPNCQVLSITGNYTDTITSLGANFYSWSDSKGWALNLVNNNNSLTYQFGSTATTAPSLLYGVNGSVFSQQDSLGGVGGQWMNPVAAVNTSNATACCIPDMVFLMVANTQNRLNVEYYYNSTNCSTNSTVFNSFSIIQPSFTSINWMLATPASTIIWNPSTTLSQFTLSWNSGICQYNYSKNPSTVNLNGNWVRDWQTSTGAILTNLTNYQIMSVTSLSTTYMISNYTLNGTAGMSYVAQTGPITYFDSYLSGGIGLNYNAPTNTLLYINTADTTNDVLLSTNGQVLTNAPYLGSWNTPVGLNNQSLLIGCCTPTQINISASTSSSPMTVLYQLPSNFNQIEGCLDFITQVDNSTGVLASTLLFTGPPNITQLNWMDSSFNSIQVTLSSTSQLVVQDMSFGCGFSMALNTAPGPKPGPLSASVMSTGIISLIAGLFMFAF